MPNAMLATIWLIGHSFGRPGWNFALNGFFEDDKSRRNAFLFLAGVTPNENVGPGRHSLYRRSRICCGYETPGRRAKLAETDAIYIYLAAVFELVAWWMAENRALEHAHKALRLRHIIPFDQEDPFAAITRCTADPAKVDKRTRSKWS